MHSFYFYCSLALLFFSGVVAKLQLYEFYMKVVEDNEAEYLACARCNNAIAFYSGKFFFKMLFYSTVPIRTYLSQYAIRGNCSASELYCVMQK